MEQRLAALPVEVATVAVSGSLGRLEAGPHSDADLIVVLQDHQALTIGGRAAMAHIWKLLAPLHIPQPNPKGIFVTAACWPELCDRASVGRVVEDVALFGKRIQLLLDTRPVYCAEAYHRLVRAVVERYAAGFVAVNPEKEWVYLLNDLVRYFRSLCLECQWDFSTGNEGWYIRNAKLRHSRVVMYAGLLFLLGACSLERCDKVGWLLGHLDKTPLERLAWVYEHHGDAHFPIIAGAYDRFLACLEAPGYRAALMQAAPAAAPVGEMPALYTELHAGSRELMGELVRFVLARRGEWSERFFEYLLF